MIKLLLNILFCYSSLLSFAILIVEESKIEIIGY